MTHYVVVMAHALYSCSPYGTCSIQYMFSIWHMLYTVHVLHMAHALYSTCSPCSPYGTYETYDLWDACSTLFELSSAM